MGNTSKKNQLAAPPAEIILDLENNSTDETSNNKMEDSKMEKTAKASRSQIVALANEMNKIVVDCKIKTSSSYSADVITNQILAQTITLVSSDFALAADDTRSADDIFSTDAIATLQLIGFEIPKPAHAKSEKVKKEKKSVYTRQLAFVDSLKTGGTTKDLAALTDKLYRTANPRPEGEIATDKELACDLFCCSKMITATLPILLALGSVEFNPESKVYSLPIIDSEDETAEM